MAIPCVMMPGTWYTHEMQDAMFKAGIQTPVYTKGLSDLFGYTLPNTEMVYLPSFGEQSLQHVYRSTGGNPIANYPRSELCIVITPTIDRFSYNRTIHGNATTLKEYMDDDCFHENANDIICVEEGHMPENFSSSAAMAREIAITTVMKYTDQRFNVVGAKLSPLTSGKGNIAIFLHFPNGCPFDHQDYLNSGIFCPINNKDIQIRIIPKPIMTKYDEFVESLKFEMKFLHVDSELYSLSFPLIRHAVIATLKDSNLRFIKCCNNEKKVVGVVQTTDLVTQEDVDKFVNSLQKIKYSPYVMLDVNVSKKFIV